MIFAIKVFNLTPSMLADSVAPSCQSGSLARDVHRVGASRFALLDFIQKELPCWRDHPDRPKDVNSETLLSEHLCDHLTGAARLSNTFDCFQFRTEITDEEKKARKIDLAVKPCGSSIIVEGRTYTQFESIMPIECKRLPTPHDAGRDPREYVVVGDKSTGGMQRFKCAKHGGAHQVAAMIGYIQQHDGDYWSKQVCAWIAGLVQEPSSIWTEDDSLTAVFLDSDAKISRLTSSHRRTEGHLPIVLHHLWIQMN